MVTEKPFHITLWNVFLKQYVINGSKGIQAKKMNPQILNVFISNPFLTIPLNWLAKHGEHWEFYESTDYKNLLYWRGFLPMPYYPKFLSS